MILSHSTVSIDWTPRGHELMAKNRCVSAQSSCRTPGINVFLMGMATPHEVETDLRVVREALGLSKGDNDEGDAKALKEIQAVFEPVKDQTWHTGRHNNRT